jgi:transposase
LAANAGRARAPQKSLTEHVATQREFLKQELQPALDAAQAGTSHVFFVDAAHFVYGTFLCCLWSIARLFVRAASGRQRFNVLGAWNAVSRQLIAVTNTTVVNTDTMCELLHRIAAAKLTGPITLVLDNARYQRNRVVQGLAVELGIRLLFLPPYSPNLNLIERLWGFAKRQSVYGKYHANFASFRAAIETTLASLSTTHADKVKSLMTLTFQEFDDVSLLAA